MSTLVWIIVGGVLMSAIAMIGSITLILKPNTLDRTLLPLVAFAAGSLIGASDLVPEVNKHCDPRGDAMNLLAFMLGLALLLFAKISIAS